MDRPRVKICGITNLADALVSANAGADYVGFIFYRKSPRYIEPQHAGEIISLLPNTIVPVGVFVNEARDLIQQRIESTGIRILQLSGDESPEECLGYKIDVWKAVRIREEHEIHVAAGYDVSAILLDGAADGQYGGSGKSADVTIARSLKHYHPLVLAGGLSPDNFLPMVQQVQPFAIDVNSGVESNPGIKDHNKIQRLFEQLNNLK